MPTSSSQEPHNQRRSKVGWPLFFIGATTSEVKNGLFRRSRPRDVLLRHLKGRIRSRSTFQPFTFNRILVPVGGDKGKTTFRVYLRNARFSRACPYSVPVLRRISRLAMQERDVLLIRRQLQHFAVNSFGLSVDQRSLNIGGLNDIQGIPNLGISFSVTPQTGNDGMSP